MGGNNAFIGFTSADGGTPSTQVISNFVFTSLIGINAVNNGDGTMSLSWPTNVGGYVLQQNPALLTGVWSNSASVSIVNGSNQATVTIGPEQHVLSPV